MLNFESVYTDPSLECDWYVALGNHDYKGEVQAEIAYSKISRRWNMPARYFAVTKKSMIPPMLIFILSILRLFSPIIIKPTSIMLPGRTPRSRCGGSTVV